MIEGSKRVQHSSIVKIDIQLIRITGPFFGPQVIKLHMGACQDGGRWYILNILVACDVWCRVGIACRFTDTVQQLSSALKAALLIEAFRKLHDFVVCINEINFILICVYFRLQLKGILDNTMSKYYYN